MPTSPPIGHAALPGRLREIAETLAGSVEASALLTAAARLERFDTAPDPEDYGPLESGEALAYALRYGAANLVAQSWLVSAMREAADRLAGPVVDAEVVVSNVRRWLIPHVDADPPQPGELVTCGPAVAVWRVLDAQPSGADYVTALEPLDPHDVPPTARVRYLPTQVTEAPAADEDTGTAGDGRGEPSVGTAPSSRTGAGGRIGDVDYG